MSRRLVARKPELCSCARDLGAPAAQSRTMPLAVRWPASSRSRRTPCFCARCARSARSPDTLFALLRRSVGHARARLGAAAALAQPYQLSFTFCLLLTDAAKALLLISLAPLWAALFGVAVLREPLPCRTGCALALSLVAVGVVFTPRLLSLQGGGYTAGPYSLAGDLLAIFTGAAQGASLTVNRHAAVHAPKADLTLATALSSLLATVVALYLLATTRTTRTTFGSARRPCGARPPS